MAAGRLGCSLAVEGADCVNRWPAAAIPSAPAFIWLARGDKDSRLSHLGGAIYRGECCGLSILTVWASAMNELDGTCMEESGVSQRINPFAGLFAWGCGE